MNLVDADQPGEDGSLKRNPKTLTPAEKFLRKTPDNLWTLGPYPGKVKRADLGLALHTYLTKQWRTCTSTSFQKP